MNNEYLSLNSKITFRNGWLNEKKFNINTQEGFYRYVTFLCLAGALTYLVYEMLQENRYGNLLLIVMTIVWLWPLLTRLYRTMIVLAWRTNVRINEIADIRLVPLENGVETKAILKLKNGRIKEIIFRNAENQLEPFMDEVSVLTSKSVTIL